MQSTASWLLDNRSRLISELFEFLHISSISTQPDYRSDVRAAAAWVEHTLRLAGPFAVETVETPGHPVVLASWHGAPGMPTLLVYGHFDVQPPDPLDQWLSDPFAPEIRDDRIYARGASDDKGPLFAALKAAEACFSVDGRLPLNLVLLMEGEEEIGSAHLEQFVADHVGELQADFALSADGAMWRSSEPSLTLGSRGLAALEVDICGAVKDLHSGRHGGAVHNPLHALAALLAGLHLPDGSVAVEGFYDGVVPPTDQEKHALAALAFEDQAYCSTLGVPALFGEAGFSTLERLWYRPTLEVNGMYGGYQGPGSKTVIPAEAHAKISCRLVPGQDPVTVANAVKRHLERYTPNGVAVTVRIKGEGTSAYRISGSHPGITVARQVLQTHYGMEPAKVLMGGTLPISDIFWRVLGIDTVFFSFSTADEDFHAPNEFFRLSRLWDGISCWIAYWKAAALIAAAHTSARPMRPEI